MKSRAEKYCFFLFALILLSSVAYPQSKDSRIFNNSTVQISEISTDSIPGGFGPSAINGTLFFTTYNDKDNEKKNKRGKKEFYDLYNVQIDKQGNMVSKSKLFNDVTSRYNDGPVAWCEKTG